MTGIQHVVWFDLPVVDLEKAMAFYEGVVGWKSKVEFGGVAVFEHRDAALGGCLYVSDEVRPSADGVLLYFNVTGRHEDAEAMAEELGGRLVSARHAIGPFGFRSVVLDPDGNRIALHSEEEAA